MRSVRSVNTLNTKIENRRVKLSENSQNNALTQSNSKKNLQQMLTSDRSKRELEDIKVKQVKPISSAKKKETDEFFNNLSLRGMPGINTTALNQQAVGKLNREREEKKLNSQRKLKKMRNTTSTQDLYLKNIGINFKNFNIKPLKDSARGNMKDSDAFIDNMNGGGVYETANYNEVDKENNN
jgi:hypothetical protein